MRTWGANRAIAWFAVVAWLLLFGWLYSATENRLFVYVGVAGIAGYFAFAIIHLAKRFWATLRK